MITAIDSSVLLDVLIAGSTHADASYNALEAARVEGAVVICPVVWAEVRAIFGKDADMDAIVEAGMRFDPFDLETASLAGKMWRAYRRKGGRRTRLIADFLVAGHAQTRADRLLTRDRGFSRRYFRNLKLIQP